ncbi:hypothetical protein [uncultured Dysgonomonas sp.]|uniref:Uncharacterized protein n=1 Tax=uncultured Dysgonomonas sp. TaxID=206096 RepID=A0A212K5Q5_9BACT|nr:hypothetical protein [uncultured Dysgonomonas sp.]SBW07049.1 conserved hypothetical protein [uncultured Dysgonomonas sp.]
MKNIINKIAQIDEPEIVSLAGNPNFVVFESVIEKESALNNKIDFNLQVLKVNDIAESETGFEFIDTSSSTSHKFTGTDNKSKVNNTTFHINRESVVITTENIRKCLLSDPFFKGNFDISIPLIINGAEIKNGTTINIVSKGYGTAYTFKSFKPENSDFISINGNYTQSYYPDSILGDDENCEIQLDIYKDTGISPGIKDYTKMGTYATTLSKSYFGMPLWFDMNTMWANTNTYSDKFLEGRGWCNTGTMTDFRFIAKRFNGVDTETFYHSDILFALTGYDRNLEKNNLSEYVYDISQNNEIESLTRQPVLTHIRGQKQYFNFILSDPAPESNDTQCKLGILYKVYTQADSYLDYKISDVQDKSDYHTVNTACLDIDKIVLDKYAKAGIVRVYLCRDGKAISKPLTYRILPDCLYKVNDFAFLGSLGGWCSFNFGGTEQTDFKSETTTIHRTQTPGYTTSSRIESVFNKDVTEQFTVQTLPINREVAEWLKEISVSIAVYELSTKRYIIVDELNVKHNSKDDLFVLQMKYHYSDSYNARIK